MYMVRVGVEVFKVPEGVLYVAALSNGWIRDRVAIYTAIRSL